MERDRKVKMLSIIALVLAITGMSLGFAAFSSTLTISSSATVTPNSDDFKFVFSGSLDDITEKIVVPNVSGGATASDALFVDNSLTRINANFTEPGQSVSYIGYGHNVGKYVVYHKQLIFKNIDGEQTVKKCVAGEGTTQALVDAACEAITLSYAVSSTRYTPTVIPQPYSMLEINSNNDIDVGEYGVGEVLIEYAADGARADGPFTVQFGDIELVMRSFN